MENQITNKIPTSFWVVSGLALIWNLMGVGAFIGQVMMSPEALAALPAEHQALYDQHPSWLHVFYALGVFGGLLGCIGLLMRKKWAAPVFVLSLVGVLVQMGYSLFLTDSVKVMGMSAAIMPIVVILICIALIWFARNSIAKGLLN